MRLERYLCVNKVSYREMDHIEFAKNKMHYRVIVICK